MYFILNAQEPHFLTMCTLFIAIDSHPNYPLIIAGNRDEFYKRKTAPLQDWGDIVGGRDLQQGGHWLAIDKKGRWAALTNYRDPANKLDNPHTRGDLVKDYLQQRLSIGEYVGSIQCGDRQYEGFNLLLGDKEGRTAHYSNVTQQLTYLSAGVYGLSNALLDTPWPKVVKGKAGLGRLLQERKTLQSSEVFSLLRNTDQAHKEDLPKTGVPVLMEQLLSALFITSPTYGTRSSALLKRLATGEVQFTEQSYGVMGCRKEMKQLCIPMPV